MPSMNGPGTVKSKWRTSHPRWVDCVLLTIVAIAFTYPCIRRGLPDGHDTQIHINYQHWFDRQIDQGDRYPRWMPYINSGLGGGIFFAQYPLPYYVAWGFGKIVPNHWGDYLETRSQGLALALATVLAALFAYAWCATFCDRFTSVLGAIIYLTLPYSLSVDLYMRVAIGEYWALCFLPLTFYFIERMAAGSRRAVPGLAVAFALVTVAHLLTAVLLAPILIFYSVLRVERGHRLMAAGQTICGMALAMGLAGVYTMPFLVHRHFMHPENYLLRGARYSPFTEMFSYNKLTFATWPPKLHQLARAARVVAFIIAGFVGAVWYRSRKAPSALPRLLLAIVSIAILVRASLAGHFPHAGGEVAGALPPTPYIVFLRSQLFVYTFLTLEAALVPYWAVQNPRNQKLANILITLALGSYIMMTSWSQIVWRSIHFLSYIQFPWRLNAFLLIATTGLAALAISDLRGSLPRRKIAGGLIALSLWGLVAVQTLRGGDLIHAFRSHESYTLTVKKDAALMIYAQADPNQAWLVKPAADEGVHVALENGSGSATVDSVEPRRIRIAAHCETPCTLQIGQFYYPAWRARIDSGDVDLHAGLPAGLMETSLPAGDHHLILELPFGWSERAGIYLSLATLCLVGFLFIRGAPFGAVSKIENPIG
jgi:hypothetical protein